MAGEDIRRPRFVPRVLGSREPTTTVEDAHREFLRMTLVTERISEWRTCLAVAGCRGAAGIVDADDIGFRNAETTTSANTSNIMADVIC